MLSLILSLVMDGAKFQCLKKILREMYVWSLKALVEDWKLTLLSLSVLMHLVPWVSLIPFEGYNNIIINASYQYHVIHIIRQ